jgi:hypothetical protein
VHPEEKIIGSEIYKGGAGRAASMAQLPHKVTKLTALYIRREKGKTPPYSIAGEKSPFLHYMQSLSRSGLLEPRIETTLQIVSITSPEAFSTVSMCG